ncbi:MAG TPA: DUF5706 domain-containing protein [Fibrobacteria bacterium]|nr:DUF5706 domain-containing protein [Fibrobacteria bacterium]
MTPEQIQSLARRSDPDFDRLDPEQRARSVERISRTLEAMDAEGWEVGKRTDRTTFDMAQWVFLRIDANIAASAPKAVIILSLHGVLLSAAILQGERIVHEAAPSLRLPVGLLLVAFFLSAAAALWLAFSSVTPRVAKATATRSLLFFGSIAHMPKREFVERFERTDRPDFTRDLLEDAHALSELADWKHRRFVRAFQIVLHLEIPIMALIAVLVSI